MRWIGSANWSRGTGQMSADAQRHHEFVCSDRGFGRGNAEPEAFVDNPCCGVVGIDPQCYGAGTLVARPIDGGGNQRPSDPTTARSWFQPQRVQIDGVGGLSLCADEADRNGVDDCDELGVCTQPSAPLGGGERDLFAVLGVVGAQGIGERT